MLVPRRSRGLAGRGRARLARVVCADPEQLAEGDLEAIAAAVEEAQIASIMVGSPGRGSAARASA